MTNTPQFLNCVCSGFYGLVIVITTPQFIYSSLSYIFPSPVFPPGERFLIIFFPLSLSPPPTDLNTIFCFDTYICACLYLNHRDTYIHTDTLTPVSPSSCKAVLLVANSKIKISHLSNWKHCYVLGTILCLALHSSYVIRALEVRWSVHRRLGLNFSNNFVGLLFVSVFSDLVLNSLPFFCSDSNRYNLVKIER